MALDILRMVCRYGRTHRKEKRKNRGTEFDLSLYSSKLGVDIFYRRTGNDYKIHNVTGFSDRIPSNYSEDFNGLKVNMKGLNLYYIFNNRRFSYPAAFSQSTNQRRNAGSLIAGLSVSTHNLKFDYTKLPEVILETMNAGMKVRHIKYTNISLNFGYAYNWVFARNCLACLSLSPAVAYKTSRIEKEAEEPSDWYKNFNIDFILRAGVVYNNSKYFVGTSFLGRTYDYYRDNFSLNNGFGTLQVYAGFNFYLKKSTGRRNNHRELPELIMFGAIFKSDGLQQSYNHFLTDIHIIAKFVQRRITITQFHVDEAEKHHRVFRQFHFYTNTY